MCHRIFIVYFMSLFTVVRDVTWRHWDSLLIRNFTLLVFSDLDEFIGSYVVIFHAFFNHYFLRNITISEFKNLWFPIMNELNMIRVFVIMILKNKNIPTLALLRWFKFNCWDQWFRHLLFITLWRIFCSRILVVLDENYIKLVAWMFDVCMICESTFHSRWTLKIFIIGRFLWLYQFDSLLEAWLAITLLLLNFITYGNF